MTRLDQLETANPVTPDDEWGITDEGRTRFASIEEALEIGELTPAVQPGHQRPWVYAFVGFAVAAAAAIPLWLLDGNGRNPLGTPDEITSGSFDDIFADFEVTKEEIELAGEELSRCVTDRAGVGKGASFTLGPRGEVSYSTNAPEELESCWEDLRMEEIVNAWSASVEPAPGEDFYFYLAAVTCTEIRTGKFFGPITMDHIGYLTSAAYRTLNRVLDVEPIAYDECVGAVIDQQAFYTGVLECLSSEIAGSFERLTDEGNARLDQAAIKTLEDARGLHPSGFKSCIRAEAELP